MKITRILAAASLCALAGCGGMQAPPSAPDPATVAKINYVCAYSGLFKFADTAATSVIPVPGAALVGTAINSAVDNACLHPETVAAGIGVVENLIGQFKSMGKM